jgi:DNA gyrase/topoisomerase IV subunit B
MEHAMREIIANALDEQLLTGSREIQIQMDGRGRLHIRDFGRGLRIKHFAPNEDNEKLASALHLGTPVMSRFIGKN